MSYYRNEQIMELRIDVKINNLVLPKGKYKLIIDVDGFYHIELDKGVNLVVSRYMFMKYAKASLNEKYGKKGVPYGIETNR